MRSSLTTLIVHILSTGIDPIGTGPPNLPPMCVYVCSCMCVCVCVCVCVCARVLHAHTKHRDTQALTVCTVGAQKLYAGFISALRMLPLASLRERVPRC